MLNPSTGRVFVEFEFPIVFVSSVLVAFLIVTLFHISDLGDARVLSVSEWRHFLESCEVAPLKLLAFQMA